MSYYNQYRGKNIRIRNDGDYDQRYKFGKDEKKLNQYFNSGDYYDKMRQEEIKKCSQLRVNLLSLNGPAPKDKNPVYIREYKFTEPSKEDILADLGRNAEKRASTPSRQIIYETEPAEIDETDNTDEPNDSEKTITKSQEADNTKELNTESEKTNNPEKTNTERKPPKINWIFEEI